jgi:MraZ protein
MDGQGRIAIPKALAEFANLTAGRALIIGAFDKIEIWDPKSFDAYTKGQTDSYEELAERVMGGL